MKKNSFIQGALISILGIVIVKIIGALYVIPFYEIVGEQGGNLYGYAYNIYSIFLSLSIGGIPVAMSKLISEYNTLGYHYTKEKTYKLGALLISIIGIISFIILLITAPLIASSILGTATGGNTVEGITLVIRIISSALLVVPILSVTKGYFQGHNQMTPSSISSIIEQFVRVAVILGGSLLVLKVFKLSLETAIGISVFAATIGALFAYFYLFIERRKRKKELSIKAEQTTEEKKITTKYIIKQIITYAVPFIIIDLLRATYSMVDTFTVVKTLTNIGYSASTAENVLSVISVWGSKLNQIITSIAIGFTLSLIPNLASSFLKKDHKDVSKKINQSLQAISLLVIPMVAGLMILAKPVWIVFYSNDLINISVYTVFVLQALTFSYYSILIDVAQTLNNAILSLGTLIGSLILKILINNPLMYLFNNINIPAYYAPVVATLLTQVIATILILTVLNKKYKVTYKESFKNILKVLGITTVMIIVLNALKLVLPLNAITKMGSVKEILIYTVVGGIIFAFLAIKTKTLNNILGQNFINKYIKRKKEKE